MVDPSIRIATREASICSIDPIDSIFERVRKIQNATFEGINPHVPGFFRTRIRFERILGRPSIDTIDTETVRYVRSIRSIRYSKKFEKFKTPHLKDLSQSSQDSFESESNPKESREFLQKWHFPFLPLLKELSRSSQDSFESDSGSKESRDVRLNSFKSGVFDFLRFFGEILANIRFGRFGIPFDSIDIASAGGGGLP